MIKQDNTYQLKNKVDSTILDLLNDTRSSLGERVLFIYKFCSSTPTIEDLDDWVSALKSGKRIVNPQNQLQCLIDEYNNALDLWNISYKPMKNVATKLLNYSIKLAKEKEQ
jgi:hypothetical protein